MILPGWISHTKYSGLPLPLPMRTSAGFCDTGLSGNTRIQMRPPRLMWRDMARRVAGIAALLLLAVLRSRRLQHDLFLFLALFLDDLLGFFHHRFRSGGFR